MPGLLLGLVEGFTICEALGEALGEALEEVEGCMLRKVEGCLLGLLLRLREDYAIGKALGRVMVA